MRTFYSIHTNILPHSYSSYRKEHKNIEERGRVFGTDNGLLLYLACWVQIVYISVMDRIKLRPTSNTDFAGKMGKPEGKEEMNSTPIRTRTLQNKENNMASHNQNMMRRPQQEETAIPHDSLITSKTVSKRKISLSPRACVNHPEADPEFKIEIEGETYGYCGKCAAHLASNGFTVERIGVPSRSPKLSKEGRSPHLRKKQELASFLNSLRKLQQDYRAKGQAIEGVKMGYQMQRESISNFYADMLDYICYMRDEHLQFLDEETQRNGQICEIEGAEIAETLEEIGSMRTDIESNIDKIVQEVEEESYMECMAYYTQKKGVHQHRLEELGEVAKHASFSTPEFIEEKLNSFKVFVDDITGILSSKASSVDFSQ